MPIVEFRATVKLPERIIIAVTDEDSFGPVSRRLDNGDTVTVTLEVPTDEVTRLLGYSRKDGKTSYAVVGVDAVAVDLVVTKVSNEDLGRLHRRDPNADEFTSHDGRFQETKELGVRVADGLCQGTNAILGDIRAYLGQFWLRPVDHGGAPSNFVDRSRTMWREPGGAWARFCPGPQVLNMGPMILLKRRRIYLESADWGEVSGRVVDGVSIPPGFKLLADARERFHQGDVRMAIVELNAAVEWAATTFVEENLKRILPAESLRTVLDNHFSRLLSDWVLPLARQHIPALVSEDWQGIQQIRKLRAGAAHSSPDPSTIEAIQRKFLDLARIAARAVARLANRDAPRTPPFWGDHSGAFSSV